MQDLFDLASKFMPGMGGIPPKMGGMFPNMGLPNMTGVNPPNFNMKHTPWRKESSDISGHYKSCVLHETKRKRKRKTFTINNKRKIARKQKLSMEAHVKRMALAMFKANTSSHLPRKIKHSINKGNNHFLESSTNYLKWLNDSSLNRYQEGSVKNENESRIKVLESKDVQTKLESSSNLFTVMEKEIETFKEKREGFMNYLETLQTEIKGLEMPFEKITGTVSNPQDGPMEKDEEESEKTSIENNNDIRLDESKIVDSDKKSKKSYEKENLKNRKVKKRHHPHIRRTLLSFSEDDKINDIALLGRLKDHLIRTLPPKKNKLLVSKNEDK